MRTFVKKNISQLFSQRTITSLKIDWLRFRARLRCFVLRKSTPSSTKLHFGCGKRFVDGWLNVDLVQSQYDVDLGAGKLPWNDNVFEVAVSQQVIEHLDIQHELFPLLKELKRCLKPNGEIWLACPDMAVVCQSYFDSKGADLLQDRVTRWPEFRLWNDAPTQHMINVLFHQGGEHKNLYDFDLLCWVLGQAGYTNCEQMREQDFANRFPQFAKREDDFIALYVKANC